MDLEVQEHRILPLLSNGSQSFKNQQHVTTKGGHVSFTVDKHTVHVMVRHFSDSDDDSYHDDELQGGHFRNGNKNNALQKTNVHNSSNLIQNDTPSQISVYLLRAEPVLKLKGGVESPFRQPYHHLEIGNPAHLTPDIVHNHDFPPDMGRVDIPGEDENSFPEFDQNAILGDFIPTPKFEFGENQNLHLGNDLNQNQFQNVSVEEQKRLVSLLDTVGKALMDMYSFTLPFGAMAFHHHNNLGPNTIDEEFVDKIPIGKPRLKNDKNDKNVKNNTASQLIDTACEYVDPYQNADNFHKALVRGLELQMFLTSQKKLYFVENLLNRIKKMQNMNNNSNLDSNLYFYSEPVFRDFNSQYQYDWTDIIRDNLTHNNSLTHHQLLNKLHQWEKKTDDFYQNDQNLESFDQNFNPHPHLDYTMRLGPKLISTIVNDPNEPGFQAHCLKYGSTFGQIERDQEPNPKNNSNFQNNNSSPHLIKILDKVREIEADPTILRNPTVFKQFAADLVEYLSCEKIDENNNNEQIERNKIISKRNEQIGDYFHNLKKINLILSSQLQIAKRSEFGIRGALDHFQRLPSLYHMKVVEQSMKNPDLVFSILFFQAVFPFFRESIFDKKYSSFRINKDPTQGLEKDKHAEVLEKVLRLQSMSLYEYHYRQTIDNNFASWVKPLVGDKCTCTCSNCTDTGGLGQYNQHCSTCGVHNHDTMTPHMFHHELGDILCNGSSKYDLINAIMDLGSNSSKVANFNNLDNFIQNDDSILFSKLYQKQDQDDDDQIISPFQSKMLKLTHKSLNIVFAAGDAAVENFKKQKILKQLKTRKPHQNRPNPPLNSSPTSDFPSFPFIHFSNTQLDAVHILPLLSLNLQETPPTSFERSHVEPLPPPITHLSNNYTYTLDYLFPAYRLSKKPLTRTYMTDPPRLTMHSNNTYNYPLDNDSPYYDDQSKDPEFKDIFANEKYFLTYLDENGLPLTQDKQRLSHMSTKRYLQMELIGDVVNVYLFPHLTGEVSGRNKKDVDEEEDVPYIKEAYYLVILTMEKTLVYNVLLLLPNPPKTQQTNSSKKSQKTKSRTPKFTLTPIVSARVPHPISNEDRSIWSCACLPHPAGVPGQVLFIFGNNRHQLFTLDIYSNTTSILSVETFHNTPSLENFMSIDGQMVVGSTSINNSFGLHNITTAMKTAKPVPIWIPLVVSSLPSTWGIANLQLNGDFDSIFHNFSDFAFIPNSFQNQTQSDLKLNFRAKIDQNVDDPAPNSPIRQISQISAVLGKPEHQNNNPQSISPHKQFPAELDSYLINAIRNNKTLPNRAILKNKIAQNLHHTALYDPLRRLNLRHSLHHVHFNKFFLLAVSHHNLPQQRYLFHPLLPTMIHLSMSRTFLIAALKMLKKERNLPFHWSNILLNQFIPHHYQATSITERITGMICAENTPANTPTVDLKRQNLVLRHDHSLIMMGLDALINDRWDDFEWCREGVNRQATKVFQNEAKKSVFEETNVVLFDHLRNKTVLDNYSHGNPYYNNFYNSLLDNFKTNRNSQNLEQRRHYLSKCGCIPTALVNNAFCAFPKHHLFTFKNHLIDHAYSKHLAIEIVEKENGIGVNNVGKIGELSTWTVIGEKIGPRVKKPKTVRKVRRKAQKYLQDSNSSSPNLSQNTSPNLFLEWFLQPVSLEERVWSLGEKLHYAAIGMVNAVVQKYNNILKLELGNPNTNFGQISSSDRDPQTPMQFSKTYERLQSIIRCICSDENVQHLSPDIHMVVVQAKKLLLGETNSRQHHIITDLDISPTLWTGAIIQTPIHPPISLFNPPSEFTGQNRLCVRNNEDCVGQMTGIDPSLNPNNSFCEQNNSFHSFDDLRQLRCLFLTPTISSESDLILYGPRVNAIYKGLDSDQCGDKTNNLSRSQSTITIPFSTPLSITPSDLAQEFALSSTISKLTLPPKNAIYFPQNSIFFPRKYPQKHSRNKAPASHKQLLHSFHLDKLYKAALRRVYPSIFFSSPTSKLDIHIHPYDPEDIDGDNIDKVMSNNDNFVKQVENDTPKGIQKSKQQTNKIHQLIDHRALSSALYPVRVVLRTILDLYLDAPNAVIIPRGSLHGDRFTGLIGEDKNSTENDPSSSDKSDFENPQGLSPQFVKKSPDFRITPEFYQQCLKVIDHFTHFSLIEDQNDSICLDFFSKVVHFTQNLDFSALKSVPNDPIPQKLEDNNVSSDMIGKRDYHEFIQNNGNKMDVSVHGSYANSLDRFLQRDLVQFPLNIQLALLAHRFISSSFDTDLQSDVMTVFGSGGKLDRNAPQIDKKATMDETDDITSFMNTIRELYSNGLPSLYYQVVPNDTKSMCLDEIYMSNRIVTSPVQNGNMELNAIIIYIILKHFKTFQYFFHILNFVTFQQVFFTNISSLKVFPAQNTNLLTSSKIFNFYSIGSIYQNNLTRLRNKIFSNVLPSSVTNITMVTLNHLIASRQKSRKESKIKSMIFTFFSSKLTSTLRMFDINHEFGQSSSINSLSPLGAVGKVDFSGGNMKSYVVLGQWLQFFTTPLINLREVVDKHVNYAKFDEFYKNPGLFVTKTDKHLVGMISHNPSLCFERSPDDIAVGYDRINLATQLVNIRSNIDHSFENLILKQIRDLKLNDRYFEHENDPPSDSKSSTISLENASLCEQMISLFDDGGDITSEPNSVPSASVESIPNTPIMANYVINPVDNLEYLHSIFNISIQKVYKTMQILIQKILIEHSQLIEFNHLQRILIDWIRDPQAVNSPSGIKATNLQTESEVKDVFQKYQQLKPQIDYFLIQNPQNRILYLNFSFILNLLILTKDNITALSMGHLMQTFSADCKLDHSDEYRDFEAKMGELERVKFIHADLKTIYNNFGSNYYLHKTQNNLASLPNFTQKDTLPFLNLFSVFPGSSLSFESPYLTPSGPHLPRNSSQDFPNLKLKKQKQLNMEDKQPNINDDSNNKTLPEKNLNPTPHSPHFYSITVLQSVSDLYRDSYAFKNLRPGIPPDEPYTGIGESQNIPLLSIKQQHFESTLERSSLLNPNMSEHFQLASLALDDGFSGGKSELGSAGGDLSPFELHNDRNNLQYTSSLPTQTPNTQSPSPLTPKYQNIPYSIPLPTHEQLIKGHFDGKGLFAVPDGLLPLQFNPYCDDDMIRLHDHNSIHYHLARDYLDGIQWGPSEIFLDGNNNQLQVEGKATEKITKSVDSAVLTQIQTHPKMFSNSPIYHLEATTLIDFLKLANYLYSDLGPDPDLDIYSENPLNNPIFTPHDYFSVAFFLYLLLPKINHKFLLLPPLPSDLLKTDRSSLDHIHPFHKSYFIRPSHDVSPQIEPICWILKSPPPRFLRRIDPNQVDFKLLDNPRGEILHPLFRLHTDSDLMSYYQIIKSYKNECQKLISFLFCYSFKSLGLITDNIYPQRGSYLPKSVYHLVPETHILSWDKVSRIRQIEIGKQNHAYNRDLFFTPLLNLHLYRTILEPVPLIDKNIDYDTFENSLSMRDQKPVLAESDLLNTNNFGNHQSTKFQAILRKTTGDHFCLQTQGWSTYFRLLDYLSPNNVYSLPSQVLPSHNSTNRVFDMDYCSIPQIKPKLDQLPLQYSNLVSMRSLPKSSYPTSGPLDVSHSFSNTTTPDLSEYFSSILLLPGDENLKNPPPEALFFLQAQNQLQAFIKSPADVASPFQKYLKLTYDEPFTSTRDVIKYQKWTIGTNLVILKSFFQFYFLGCFFGALTHNGKVVPIDPILNIIDLSIKHTGNSHSSSLVEMVLLMVRHVKVISPEKPFSTFESNYSQFERRFKHIMGKSQNVTKFSLFSNLLFFSDQTMKSNFDPTTVDLYKLYTNLFKLVQTLSTINSLPPPIDPTESSLESFLYHHTHDKILDPSKGTSTQNALNSALGLLARISTIIQTRSQALHFSSYFEPSSHPLSDKSSLSLNSHSTSPASGLFEALFNPFNDSTKNYYFYSGTTPPKPRIQRVLIHPGIFSPKHRRSFLCSLSMLSSSRFYLDLNLQMINFGLPDVSGCLATPEFEGTLDDSIISADKVNVVRCSSFALTQFFENTLGSDEFQIARLPEIKPYIPNPKVSPPSDEIPSLTQFNPLAWGQFPPNISLTPDVQRYRHGSHTHKCTQNDLIQDVYGCFGENLRNDGLFCSANYSTTEETNIISTCLCVGHVVNRNNMVRYKKKLQRLKYLEIEFNIHGLERGNTMGEDVAESVNCNIIGEFHKLRNVLRTSPLKYTLVNLLHLQFQYPTLPPSYLITTPNTPPSRPLHEDQSAITTTTTPSSPRQITKSFPKPTDALRIITALMTTYIRVSQHKTSSFELQTQFTRAITPLIVLTYQLREAYVFIKAYRYIQNELLPRVIYLEAIEWFRTVSKPTLSEFLNTKKQFLEDFSDLIQAGISEFRIEIPSHGKMLTSEVLLNVYGNKYINDWFDIDMCDDETKNFIPTFWKSLNGSSLSPDSITTDDTNLLSSNHVESNSFDWRGTKFYKIASRYQNEPLEKILDSLYYGLKEEFVHEDGILNLPFKFFPRTNQDKLEYSRQSFYLRLFSARTFDIINTIHSFVLVSIPQHLQSKYITDTRLNHEPSIIPPKSLSAKQATPALGLTGSLNVKDDVTVDSDPTTNNNLDTIMDDIDRINVSDSYVLTLGYNLTADKIEKINDKDQDVNHNGQNDRNSAHENTVNSPHYRHLNSVLFGDNFDQEFDDFTSFIKVGNSPKGGNTEMTQNNQEKITMTDTPIEKTTLKTYHFPIPLPYTPSESLQKRQYYIDVVYPAMEKGILTKIEQISSFVDEFCRNAGQKMALGIQSVFDVCREVDEFLDGSAANPAGFELCGVNGNRASPKGGDSHFNQIEQEKEQEKEQENQNKPIVPLSISDLTLPTPQTKLQNITTIDLLHSLLTTPPSNQFFYSPLSTKYSTNKSIPSNKLNYSTQELAQLTVLDMYTRNSFLDTLNLETISLYGFKFSSFMLAEVLYSMAVYINRLDKDTFLLHPTHPRPAVKYTPSPEKGMGDVNDSYWLDYTSTQKKLGQIRSQRLFGPSNASFRKELNSGHDSFRGKLQTLHDYLTRLDFQQVLFDIEKEFFLISYHGSLCRGEKISFGRENKQDTQVVSNPPTFDSHFQTPNPFNDDSVLLSHLFIDDFNDDLGVDLDLLDASSFEKKTSTVERSPKSTESDKENTENPPTFKPTILTERSSGREESINASKAVGLGLSRSNETASKRFKSTYLDAVRSPAMKEYSTKAFKEIPFPKRKQIQELKQKQSNYSYFSFVNDAFLLELPTNPLGMGPSNIICPPNEQFVGLCNDSDENGLLVGVYKNENQNQNEPADKEPQIEPEESQNNDEQSQNVMEESKANDDKSLLPVNGLLQTEWDNYTESYLKSADLNGDVQYLFGVDKVGTKLENFCPIHRANNKQQESDEEKFLSQCLQPLDLVESPKTRYLLDEVFSSPITAIFMDYQSFPLAKLQSFIDKYLPLAFSTRHSPNTNPYVISPLDSDIDRLFALNQAGKLFSNFLEAGEFLHQTIADNSSKYNTINASNSPQPCKNTILHDNNSIPITLPSVDHHEALLQRLTFPLTSLHPQKLLNLTHLLQELNPFGNNNNLSLLLNSSELDLHGVPAEFNTHENEDEDRSNFAQSSSLKDALPPQITPKCFSLKLNSPFSLKYQTTRDNKMTDMRSKNPEIKPMTQNVEEDLRKFEELGELDQVGLSAANIPVYSTTEISAIQRTPNDKAYSHLTPRLRYQSQMAWYIFQIEAKFRRIDVVENLDQNHHKRFVNTFSQIRNDDKNERLVPNDLIKLEMIQDFEYYFDLLTKEGGNEGQNSDFYAEPFDNNHIKPQMDIFRQLYDQLFDHLLSNPPTVPPQTSHSDQTTTPKYEYLSTFVLLCKARDIVLCEIVFLVKPLTIVRVKVHDIILSSLQYHPTAGPSHINAYTGKGGYYNDHFMSGFNNHGMNQLQSFKAVKNCQQFCHDSPFKRLGNYHDSNFDTFYNNVDKNSHICPYSSPLPNISPSQNVQNIHPITQPNSHVVNWMPSAMVPTQSLHKPPNPTGIVTRPSFITKKSPQNEYRNYQNNSPYFTLNLLVTDWYSEIGISSHNSGLIIPLYQEAYQDCHNLIYDNVSHERKSLKPSPKLELGGIFGTLGKNGTATADSGQKGAVMVNTNTLRYGPMETIYVKYNPSTYLEYRNRLVMGVLSRDIPINSKFQQKYHLFGKNTVGNTSHSHRNHSPIPQPLHTTYSVSTPLETLLKTLLNTSHEVHINKIKQFGSLIFVATFACPYIYIFELVTLFAADTDSTPRLRIVPRGTLSLVMDFILSRTVVPSFSDRFLEPQENKDANIAEAKKDNSDKTKFKDDSGELINIHQVFMDIITQSHTFNFHSDVEFMKNKLAMLQIESLKLEKEAKCSSALVQGEKVWNVDDSSFNQFFAFTNASSGHLDTSNNVKNIISLTNSVDYAEDDDDDDDDDDDYNQNGSMEEIPNEGLICQLVSQNDETEPICTSLKPKHSQAIDLWVQILFINAYTSALEQISGSYRMLSGFNEKLSNSVLKKETPKKTALSSPRSISPRYLKRCLNRVVMVKRVHEMLNHIFEMPPSSVIRNKASKMIDFCLANVPSNSNQTHDFSQTLKQTRRGEKYSKDEYLLLQLLIPLFPSHLLPNLKQNLILALYNYQFDMDLILDDQMAGITSNNASILRNMDTPPFIKMILFSHLLSQIEQRDKKIKKEVSKDKHTTRNNFDNSKSDQNSHWVLYRLLILIADKFGIMYTDLDLYQVGMNDEYRTIIPSEGRVEKFSVLQVYNLVTQFPHKFQQKAHLRRNSLAKRVKSTLQQKTKIGSKKDQSSTNTSTSMTTNHDFYVNLISHPFKFVRDQIQVFEKQYSGTKNPQHSSSSFNTDPLRFYNIMLTHLSKELIFTNFSNEIITKSLQTFLTTPLSITSFSQNAKLNPSLYSILLFNTLYSSTMNNTHTNGLVGTKNRSNLMQLLATKSPVGLDKNKINHFALLFNFWLSKGQNVWMRHIIPRELLPWGNPWAEEGIKWVGVNKRGIQRKNVQASSVDYLEREYCQNYEDNAKKITTSIPPPGHIPVTVKAPVGGIHVRGFDIYRVDGDDPNSDRQLYPIFELNHNKENDPKNNQPNNPSNNSTILTTTLRVEVLDSIGCLHLFTLKYHYKEFFKP